MNMLSMCRICLVNNGHINKYYVLNSHLQDVYEKLTALPFTVKDGRPLQVCYICHAKLKNCYQLQTSCLQSEELFTQMLEKNELQLTQLEISTSYNIVTQKINLNIICESSNKHNDSIKIESIDVKNEPVETQDEVHLKNEDFEDNALSDENSVECKELKDIFCDIVDSKLSSLNVDVYEDKLPSRNELSIEGIEVDHSNHSTELDQLSNRSIEKRLKIDNYNLNNYICAGQKDENITLKGKNQTIPNKRQRKRTGMSVLRKPKFVAVKEYPRSGNSSKPEKKRGIKPNKVENTKSQKKYLNNKDLYTGPKIYKCDICQKTFKVSSNLKAHVRIHTGEKPYKCDVCGKCYRQRQHLNVHIVVCTGEKQERFKCNICDKYFTRKSILINHTRTHTGEKPYKCDICNKRFSVKDNLIRHKRIHTGEKPFKCDICEKSFNQRSVFMSHSRTHSGEKPYKCNICEKFFTRKYGLNEHTRLHNH